jgi:FkbM family methyltransferase
LPDLAAHLRKKFRYHLQVKIVECAVSNHEGSTTFHHVKDANGYSGIRQRSLPPELVPSIAKIVVDLRRIDSILEKLIVLRRLRTSFIKLDIEGGEYHAIAGARGIIRRDKPLLAFECGDATKLYGYSREEFFRLFDEIGYGLFDIFGQPYDIETWSRPNRPWYLIGAPRGSEDFHFAQQHLPALVSRVERLGGYE